ncbi:site-specific integrase [Saccharomonospora sp. NPDC006951]
MGRPPMDVGTYGKIRYVTLANGGVRAKARLRGFDGVVRDISRTGATETKAERALKKAINDEMRAPTGGAITARNRFKDVADLWMSWQQRRVNSGDRATGTFDNYQSMLNNHVIPALGELRLSEVTVPRLDKFFPTLQDKTSAAHARTARAVVSGILRYAVRHGAITTNPAREIEPITGGTKKKARALTLDERKAWLAQLELDPKATALDLPDLTRFMLATGVRIGEALALHWEDVDLDAGMVSISYTVIRVRGVGLVRKSPKTDSGIRVLPLPGWARDMLRKRHVTAVAEHRADAHPVFPDSLGGLRDPSNTRRALRAARGSDGFAWVTSHVFRKTAGTVLDEAKLSARQIADQLGHARPSMTQDVYMGRGAVSNATADALEDML